MTEKYAEEAGASFSRSWRDSLVAAAALVRMIWHAKPFLEQVFLAPMDKTDPSGKRLKEAIKRIQLVGRKPSVARRPFTRVMLAVQDAFNHPVIGRLAGPVLLRIAGGDARTIKRLFTDEELARSQRMSFDELAEEALAAKNGA
jgi:hypothetical protein